MSLNNALAAAPSAAPLAPAPTPGFEVTPGLTGAPAVVPGAPAAPPATILVGTENLPAAEVARLVAAGRTVETVKTQAKEALELQTLWNNMPPALRTQVTDMVEAAAQQEQARKMGIPIDTLPPEMQGVATIPFKDLSDEGKMVVSSQAKMANTVMQLQSTVASLTQMVESLHGATQDDRLAQALVAKGFEGATAETVRKMRASGIADPIKAFDMFGPLLRQQFVAGAQTQQNQPGAPPEAPTAQAGYYDDNDPNLTADQELEYINRGLRPMSEATR